MLRSGDQIGPYTLISKLGKGAFGVVWLAERRTQIATTTAAIKIPLDEDINLEKIRQEADLWVRASGHPNVLPIIEADIYDDQIIIASEYAPDGSLDAYLKRNGKAPTIEAAVEIVLGILAGLEHLHSRNIIHRDLKPANILFQGSTPRLADFGISRVLKSTSQSSIVAGTPSYMAPEAFDGKRSEQTDIWSVGVIFYQLLTGRLPFAQEDITSLVGAILTRSPEPLPREVPQGLQNIIARALAKDTNARYKSAAEMRADLRNPTETNPNFQPEKSVYTVQSPVNIFRPQSVYSPPEKRSNAPHFIYAVAGLLAVLIIVVSTMIFLLKMMPNSDSFSANNPANISSQPQQPSTESTKAATKPTLAQPTRQTVKVDAKTYWTNSNIRLREGDRVNIEASGQINLATSGDFVDKWVGPNGWGYIPSMYNNNQPARYIYPINDSLGCLIGKIGKNGRPFKIGSSISFTAEESGTLFLSVNDAISDYQGNLLSESDVNSIIFGDNQGAFSATISVK